MKKHLMRDSSVGFVLFVATLVAMTGLFFVGNGHGILADRVEFNVLMKNANGLRQGSRVYLSGVRVGNVGQIDFSPDLKGDKVLVTLGIGQQYARRIGESSVAWLKNEGLLGDTALHISLSGESKELTPGSEIPYRPRAMLDDFTGEGTTRTATDLLQTVMDILKDFQKGEGSLGQLLKNPELYENLNSFAKAMRSATEEAERVTGEVEIMLTAVRDQKGTLGKLIYSESYAREIETSLKDADKLIVRLDQIAAKIESGAGSIGKFLNNTDFYDTLTQTLLRVSRAAQTTERVLNGLDESGSVVGRLLRDEELGDRFQSLVGRLANSARFLESILEKVESGEGSIGMLVHDPSIAGSLRDVFLGVKELGYVQNLVRNAEKAGRDAYLHAARLDEAQQRELIRIRSLTRLRGRAEGDEAFAAPATVPESREDPSAENAAGGGPRGDEGKVVPAAATDDKKNDA